MRTDFIEKLNGRVNVKGYLNLWGVGRGFRGNCTSLAGDKVLEMPYLYEKEVQVLAGHNLTKERGSLTWLRLHGLLWCEQKWGSQDM